MTKLPISKLVNNTGQIEGLPANPRRIDQPEYLKLINSLKEDPEFLEHKPLHVFPFGDQYVVLGGNQRLKALRELGIKDVPCTVYKADTPVDLLAARVIKDNSDYGKWDNDALLRDWQIKPLDDWGIDMKSILPTKNETPNNKEIDTESLLNSGQTTICPHCGFEFVPGNEDDE